MLGTGMILDLCHSLTRISKVSEAVLSLASYFAWPIGTAEAIHAVQLLVQVAMGSFLNGLESCSQSTSLKERHAHTCSLSSLKAAALQVPLPVAVLALHHAGIILLPALTKHN